MPFPTTPLLDDFNRADGGLGANWTGNVEAGLGVLTLASNQLIGPVSNYGTALWNPTLFNPNQECYFTMQGASTDYNQVYLRIKNAGASVDCYAVVFQPSSGIKVYRTINGVTSAALATLTGTPANGWKVGATVTSSGADNIIEAWADSGAGWTSRGTYTDVAASTDLNGSGGSNIGVAIFGSGSTTRAVDDFGGGDIVTSPQFVKPFNPVPFMSPGRI